MPFSATVYRILVASPADVQEERNAIPEVVGQWNAINAELKHAVLMPVLWETHAAPMLGARPQAVVNEQLVHGCDKLVGVFWTRLGTPTRVSESGTVEEIEWFIDQARPVMLYFTSRQTDLSKLDVEQFKAPRPFQEKMRKIGLTGSYEDLADFREKLLGQLSMNVDRLIAGDLPSKPNAKQAKTTAKELRAIARSGTAYVEDYEKNGVVKSFVVEGDTKSLKEELKGIGGRWNRTLGGWTFPKTKEVEVAALLKKRST